MEQNKNSYLDDVYKLVKELVNEYRDLNRMMEEDLPQDLLTYDVWNSLHSAFVDKWSFKIEELMEEKIDEVCIK